MKGMRANSKNIVVCKFIELKLRDIIHRPLCPELREFYNNTRLKSCDLLDDDFDDVFDEIKKFAFIYFGMMSYLYIQATESSKSIAREDFI